MKTVREAIPQDAEQIAEISANSLGYPCDPCLVTKRLETMETKKQKVFVAEEDHAVVGFVHAELYQLLYQEDMTNIPGLAVSKEAQGKGHGRALMQAVEQWAEEINCTAVRLNSAESRTQAHAFYEKPGYKYTKSQKRFVKALF